MRPFFISASFILFLPSLSVVAQCRTQHCLDQMKPLRTLAAVIVDAASPNLLDSARFVRESGGRVALFGEHLFLAWIDPKLDHTLRGRRGIERIHRGSAPLSVIASTLLQNRRDAPLVRSYDQIKNGRMEAILQAGVDAPPVTPLYDDAIALPPSNDLTDGSRTIDTKKRVPFSQSERRISTDSSTAPPWTFPSMEGDFVVVLFETESDGSIDSNTYSWSVEDIGNLEPQILYGLTFWSDQAASRGKSVSFGLSPWEAYAANAKTGYEPITHPGTDSYLWVADILRKQDTNAPYYVTPGEARPGGYVTSPVNFSSVRALCEDYNEYVRTHYISGYSFTGAYTVFIAHDGGPGNVHKFTDNKVAFAYYGGPWIQTTYNNGGFGYTRYKQVLTHETGHIFWACDEYSGPGGCNNCAYCLPLGPRIVGGVPTVSNANCNTTGTSCTTHVFCMMDTSDFYLCPITAQQIGW